MRSDAHEVRLEKSGRRGSRRRPVDLGPVEALDEAFALADDADRRRDAAHAGVDADDLEVAVRDQLAALAEQSRELTRLLNRLETAPRD